MTYPKIQIKKNKVNDTYNDLENVFGLVLFLLQKKMLFWLKWFANMKKQSKQLNLIVLKNSLFFEIKSVKKQLIFLNENTFICFNRLDWR